MARLIFLEIPQCSESDSNLELGAGPLEIPEPLPRWALPGKACKQEC